MSKCKITVLKITFQADLAQTYSHEWLVVPGVYRRARVSAQ